VNSFILPKRLFARIKGRLNWHDPFRDMTLTIASIDTGSVQSGADERPLSLARRIDWTLLCILFVFILLYRLQFVAGWITDLRVRELLYAVLYFRVFFFYKPRMTKILLLLLLYLAYCMVVGVHTFFLYGSEMAIKGFMRFVNVALLAPLFATFVTSRRQVNVLLYIWLAVACLGAVSAVYQLAGGDLTIITGGYGTTRGEAMRYMTLLGEPNIGGMASPIVLLIAVFIVRNSILKTITIIVAMVLLTLSISKAGLVGFGLAIILIVWQQYRLTNHFFKIRLMRTALFAFSLSGLAVGSGVVLSLLHPDFIEKIQVYGQTAVIAFTGQGDPDHVSPSFIDDLSNRLFKMTSAGIEQAKAESSLYILNVFLGSSFGIAGTAAEEIRGDYLVITPHNGFAETYFVGGVFMLFLFMLILYFVFRRLWRLSKKDRFFGALWASCIICAAFTVGYSIMSSIFLGSFFWLTIGVAANYSITKKQSLGS
jgi:hypothetical protein